MVEHAAIAGVERPEAVFGSARGLEAAGEPHTAWEERSLLAVRVPKAIRRRQRAVEELRIARQVEAVCRGKSDQDSNRGTGYRLLWMARIEKMCPRKVSRPTRIEVGKQEHALENL